MNNADEIRILVIDDEEAYRRMMIEMLTGKLPGVKTVEASDGAVGLDTLKAHPFDCVLLDYQLPRKDGMQVLEEALESGAVQLGLPLEQLEYEIRERGDRGLFGMGRRGWVLQVYQAVAKETPLSSSADEGDTRTEDAEVELTNRPGEIIPLCKMHTKEVLVAGLRWNLSQMEDAVTQTIDLIIGMCADDEDEEEEAW